MKRLLSGSAILPSHRDSDHKVQDPYSLRCVPQVHGAARGVANQSNGSTTLAPAPASITRFPPARSAIHPHK